jgi:hypothetical protein
LEKAERERDNLKVRISIITQTRDKLLEQFTGIYENFRILLDARNKIVL